MTLITLYHNPQCSKSRQALELLRQQGIEPVLVEYLKTPLTLEQLQVLRMHFSLEDFVRIDEPLFKELGLSLENEPQVLQAVVKNPILMQRPIVTCNEQTIIARPAEKVLELLKSN